MRSTVYKAEAHLYFNKTSDFSDWVRAIVESLEPPLRPTHFNHTDRLRRRWQRATKNEEALRAYLSSANSCYLLGSDYELWASQNSNYFSMTLVFKLTQQLVRMFPKWLWVLDVYGLRYACAGLAAEFKHRNGFTIRAVEEGAGTAHGWVGRDHERYVPGLYWVNYISHDYANRRGLDPVAIGHALEAAHERLQWGVMLRLYSDPKEWHAHDARVDALLFSNAAFFSKKRLSIPASLPSRQIIAYLSMLKTWR